MITTRKAEKVRTTQEAGTTARETRAIDLQEPAKIITVGTAKKTTKAKIGKETAMTKHGKP